MVWERLAAFKSAREHTGHERTPREGHKAFKEEVTKVGSAREGRRGHPGGEDSLKMHKDVHVRMAGRRRKGPEARTRLKHGRRRGPQLERPMHQREAHLLLKRNRKRPRRGTQGSDRERGLQALVMVQ